MLYAKYGRNDALYNLLKKGPTDFTRKKLLDELTMLYLAENARALANTAHTGVIVRSVSLKTQDHGKNVNTSPSGLSEGKPEDPAEGISNGPIDDHNLPETPIVSPAIDEPRNEDLWLAAKREADTLYKTVMNKRAELFALGRMDDMTDPNAPNRIEARRQLALDVVQGFAEVSLLYERADYVKQHGRLPDMPEMEEPDSGEIPDHLVKQALDNARKNFSKMKNREQTAMRVALLQKHEETIKQLEKRWHSLKQVAT